MTNPFLQAWCATPMERIFDTLDDMEVNVLVAGALGEQLGDSRFADYWRFVTETEPGRLHPAGVQRLATRPAATGSTTSTSRARRASPST